MSILNGFVLVNNSLLGFWGHKDIGTVNVPNNQRGLSCQGRAVRCVLHLSQALFGANVWKLAGLNLKRKFYGYSCRNRMHFPTFLEYHYSELPQLAQHYSN